MRVGNPGRGRSVKPYRSCRVQGRIPRRPAKRRQGESAAPACPESLKAQCHTELPTRAPGLDTGYPRHPQTARTVHVHHTTAGPRKFHKRKTQLQTQKSELLCAPAWCDFAPPGAPVFSFCFLIKERRAGVRASRETHSSLQPFEGLRTSSFQMGSQEKDRRICFMQAVRRPSSPGGGRSAGTRSWSTCKLLSDLGEDWSRGCEEEWDSG